MGSAPSTVGSQLHALEQVIDIFCPGPVHSKYLKMEYGLLNPVPATLTPPGSFLTSWHRAKGMTSAETPGP